VKLGLGSPWNCIPLYLVSARLRSDAGLDFLFSPPSTASGAIGVDLDFRGQMDTEGRRELEADALCIPELDPGLEGLELDARVDVEPERCLVVRAGECVERRAGDCVELRDDERRAGDCVVLRTGRP